MHLAEVVGGAGFVVWLNIEYGGVFVGAVWPLTVDGVVQLLSIVED